MSFQFLSNNVTKLPIDLAARLAELNHPHELMQRIQTYLLKTHHRRLRLQRTVDNQRMRPRKVTQWNGKNKPKKMLQGLRHFETARSRDSVQLGYSRQHAALARWHNEGLVGADDLKKRPRRDWLGLSAVDQRVISHYIQQHLSSL